MGVQWNSSTPGVRGKWKGSERKRIAAADIPECSGRRRKGWKGKRGVIKVSVEESRGGSVNQGKVKWGVLGVAGIAVRKVIPGMQKGVWSEITAIASRDLKKAEKAAKSLGIPKAYGSDEEVLGDPSVERGFKPVAE